MIETATTVDAYLECPSCGARYLPRSRRQAEQLRTKPFWFDCPRCKKRVRSANRLGARAELEASCASCE